MYHHHTLGISFFSSLKQLFHNISFFKKPYPMCFGEDKKVFQKLVVPRGRFFDEYGVSTDILQLELPKDIAIIVRSL
jgi:hypothetical protein